MTYEDVLDWLSENVPVDMYDDYRDWYNACRNEIQTPALWDNPRFNRMHEQYWKDNKIERVEFEKVETEISEPTSEPTITEERTFTTGERKFFRQPTLLKDTTQQADIVIDESGSTAQIPKTGTAPRLTNLSFNFASNTIPATKGFFQSAKRTLLDLASFFRRNKMA